MPEVTDDFFRIPNPNFNGADFVEGETRTSTISEEEGVEAVYAPLSSGGEYKVKTFLFARAKWASVDVCEAWVREHRESFKHVGHPQEAIVTCEVTFPTRPSGSRPTADELELINNYTLEKFSADDIYVREMQLTNDQWSRNHIIRLSQGFQRSVMGTMTGKSLLMGHPEASFSPAVPEGRFFAATTKHDKETGITWGLAKFWVVSTSANEHLRKQIDGGVFSHTSIGVINDQRICSICGKEMFDMGAGCPHIPREIYDLKEVVDPALDPEPVEGQPGKVWCGMIFRGQGQALEGSIVYLPELHGTKIIAEAALAARRGEYANAKRLMLGRNEDPPNGDNDAPGAGDETQVTEPDNATGTVDVEDGDPMGDEATATLEKQLSAEQEKVTTLEGQIAELAKTAEEQAPKLETLEKAAEAEKTFRAGRLTELERLAGLTERVSELDTFKEAFGADLAAMPADKMLAMETDWTKVFDEQTPGAGRQSTDTTRDAGTGEETPTANQPRRLVCV